MAQPHLNTSVSRQVELIIRKLSSLSVLPQTARKLFTLFSQQGVQPQGLADIISSDAALTAKILSIGAQSGIQDDSVEALCRKLPISTIRDAALAVKIFEAFDPDYDPDSKRPLPRKQLVIHSLAVAIASRLIAQHQPALKTDPHTAFAAGLLHDIGKLAIDEVMPKSFEKIVQESKSLGVSIASVEKKTLGVDHCVIGKRLGEKWNLPEDIITAVWLHHEDMAMPEIAGSNLARIVNTADELVRSLSMGDSGNYESTDFAEDILTAIGLERQQSSELIVLLDEQLQQKKTSLGLDSSAQTASFITAVQNTAASVAKLNTELNDDNIKLHSETAVSKFLNQFVADIKPQSSPIEIASAFAAGFARTYQAGNVCVLLKGENNELETALVTPGNTEYTVIAIPADIDWDSLRNIKIPGAAQPHLPWVYKQLNDKLDPQARLLLLTIGPKLIGLMIFETSRPQLELPSIQQALTLFSTLVALAQSNYKQKRLSENFAYLLRELKEASAQLASTKSMLSAAELAAGAAHEFNNPLAVISGRAQLLIQSESDPQRLQMLKQIQERSTEITSMISDLMFFANPPAPAKTHALLAEIIHNAIKNAAATAGLSQPEIHLSGLESVPTVFVDPGQITTALSNIIENAFESYPGSSGPVSISVTSRQDAEQAEIKIKDSGCGMDPATLAKATNPFFSNRLAGRKRGIGLSHAHRLLGLNNAAIKLTSAPNVGTTATITLPCRPGLGQ